MKNLRKGTGKKYLIAVLVVFILALAIGYAAFSDTLKITGTANANGTFDLQFQNVSVDSVVGANVEGTTAKISDDKNTLTVAVKDLAYPGAGAQFTVEIANIGTVPAKVNSVTPTNITGSDNIKIKGLDVITADHPVIDPEGICTLTFTVVWDPDATGNLTDEEKTGISFNLEINYTQATENVFNGEASHADA